MRIEKIEIGLIKLNPNNPRIIKDDKFKKLVRSIKEFPQMLEVRPIVVDDDGVVLGGNMRLKACIEAGLSEVHIIRFENLTDEKKKEFIIKDNVGYGEWDFEVLANDWSSDLLIDWGIDMPHIMDEPNGADLIGDEKNKPPTMRITFENVEDLQKAEIDIAELLDRLYPNAYFSVSAGEI